STIMARQQDLTFPCTRGGARKGAGRPRITSRRASERHLTRPFLATSTPVHVTIRAVPGLGCLRRPATNHAIREATIVAAKREQFRIVHLSIQNTHVHLIVEARDRMAMARGVQGFE